MKIRVHISCITLCLFLLLASPVSAQQFTPHLGLEVGSAFGTTGSSASMFSHSLAPRLTWDLSKDFQFVAGTIFSTTRFNGLPAHTSHIGGNQALFGHDGGRMLSSTVYAFGVYHVNQRLSVTGGTWFEQSNFNMHDSFLNNQFDTQHNPRGMMLGLDYRVNENFRFGIEVSASTGYSPFYPTSFQHSPFYGNFHNNRMIRH